MMRCMHLFLIVILGFGMTGCVFKDLQAELTAFDQTYAIVGRIKAGSTSTGPILVLLLEPADGGHNVGYSVFGEATGDFSFLVPQGVYTLAAFEDANNNLRCDPGEPSGVYDAPILTGPLSKGGDATDKDGSIGGLTLRLQSGNELLETFPELTGTSLFGAPSFVRVGTIARLDDPAFDQANGSLGYWKPATFLKNLGVGIYFLEPFDPHKQPVLFVHGAIGTPAGFSAIVASMDRDRYQPWFFYYPSGVRLNLVVDALVEIVKQVRDAYAFDKLLIVAHSMGGLVSREFIHAYTRTARPATIGAFVSISTPWGGSQMAAKGAENAPVAVPSWHDMAPESSFIRDLYARNLPEGVRHYLLFGFKGDCSLFMANNDGTVELESQLDYRAQREARAVVGFNEDHMSILESPEVMDTVNRILATYGQEKISQARQGVGP